MHSWAPGQGDRNHLLEFCEYRRTEDPVRLMFSSSGITRIYKWRTGLVRMELSSNSTGRRKFWALRVTGGFQPRVHTSISVRGHQWRWALVDALTAATLELPADTRIRPAQAPAGGPRSLHSHPSSLLCATQSLILRDCSPLQREQFGVHFWLFWFLAVLGIRKGYGATRMTPTPRKEPTGRKGQLCVCSSEGAETLSFDNRWTPFIRIKAGWSVNAWKVSAFLFYWYHIHIDEKRIFINKQKKRPKNEFLKWAQHLGARDHGPHPFLLRVFHYCLLTISAHQGPWTIHECKTDTAQIDSVTSHRHVWIMRFGCSLSHSEHISVTDLSKIWLGKVSFLREGISFFFFFLTFFGKRNKFEQTQTLYFKLWKKLELA